MNSKRCIYCRTLILAGKDLVSKQTHENEEKALWGNRTQSQTVFPQQPCLQRAAELSWLPAVLSNPVSSRRGTSSSLSRPRFSRVLVAEPVSYEFFAHSACFELLSTAAILGVPSRTHDWQMRFFTKQSRGFRGKRATISFHLSLDAIIGNFLSM